MQGTKVYIGCAIAAVVVIANHYGYDIPVAGGTSLQPQDWLQNLWTIAMLAAGRSAVKKIGTGN